MDDLTALFEGAEKAGFGGDSGPRHPFLSTLPPGHYKCRVREIVSGKNFSGIPFYCADFTVDEILRVGPPAEYNDPEKHLSLEDVEEKIESGQLIVRWREEQGKHFLSGIKGLLKAIAGGKIEDENGILRALRPDDMDAAYLAASASPETAPIGAPLVFEVFEKESQKGNKYRTQRWIGPDWTNPDA